ncbi:MFS transporter [Deinococcus sp.]|uniref:MFS transporter n=1 Tax=Deinococcus sp. TaxID=47478 RepID=UPI003CC61C0F
MLFKNISRMSAIRAYLSLEAVQSLAFSLAFTLQGLYFVQQAHLTPLQLLLVGAVLEGSAFLLEVPTGVIADLYSRRLSIVLGCAFLGVGMLLVGSFPTFGVILGAQLVSALGYTCLSGAQESWLADELGEERLGALLLQGAQVGRLAGVLGILAAAGLGTFGLATLGLGLPMLLGGALLLGLSLVLHLGMPEDGFTPAPPQERQGWAGFGGTLLGGVRAVRGSRVLGLLVLAALLSGASSEAFDRLNEFQLLRGVGLPGVLPAPLWFAALSLAGLVAALIVTEPLRRRLEHLDARRSARTLSVLTALMAAALLLFAFAHGFVWAAAAMTALNVLRGLYGPLYSAWLNAGLASRHRATVNSLASQADALGQVSFGPLFGLAGNVWGVPAALALAALVRLPILLLLRRGGKQAQTP